MQAAILGEESIHLSDSPYVFEREYLSGMAFNPTGNWLITGGSIVRTWSVAETAFTYTSASELRGLTIFAHHPDSSEVATMRPGNYLHLINTPDMVNRYLTRLVSRSLPASTFLEYTADGTAVILGAGGQSPKVYDTETGQLLLTLEGIDTQDFHDMTLSHNGELLFVATDSGVYLWDLSNMTEDTIEAQHLSVPYAVRQVAISPDSTRLFLVAQDSMVHVLGMP